MQLKFTIPKSIIAMGLAALIAWPTGVYAQDDPPMYCATLAAEDCEVLSMARMAMQQVHSLSSDAKFELIISNIPDVPFDEITLDMDQQSAFSFSDEGMAIREELGDVEMLRGMLQEDPAAFLGLYSELMVGSNFESSVHLSVSEDTMALIQQAIEEESGDPIPFTLPNEFGISSRLIDGTLYSNLSEMLDPLPGIKAIGDVWFGFEYAPMMDLTMAAARADGDFDPMNEDDAAIAAQFIAAAAGSNGGPLVVTVAGFPYSEDILPSLSVERVEDEGDTVRIRTTIDYSTLLAEPIVKELLADLIRDPDFGDMQMSDDEMTEMLAVIQLMGPTVLESLGLEIIEEIDPETGYVMTSEFHLNWDIDALAPLISMAGGPDLSDLENTPVISMNGTAAYSDHNSDIVIETPTSALIFSSEELLELIPEEELQELLNGPEPSFDVAEQDASDTVAAAIAAADAETDASLTVDERAASELLTIAQDSIDAGEYETAAALLDEALLLDSSNAMALAERGFANGELGLYEEAVADYDAALAIEPAYDWIYQQRADLHYQFDEYELALVDYNSAIVYDMNNAVHYLNRALVYYFMDDYEKEIADYTTAIALEPEYTTAYYYRGLSYQDIEEFELAIADYSQALALDPEETDIYVYRGESHAELGQTAEAIADLSLYLELEPDAVDRGEIEAMLADLQ